MSSTVLFYNNEMLVKEGGFKQQVYNLTLGELVGVLCHDSQRWSISKTILLLLYMLLSEYRGTWEGNPKLLVASVALNDDCE